MTAKAGRLRELQDKWPRIYIAEWCAFRGLSQAELARHAGVSEALISQLFSGQTNGGPRSLEAIAAALRISLGALFRPPPRPGTRNVTFSIADRDLPTVKTMLSAIGAKLIEDDG